jgi:hypothetical protein
VEVGEPESVCVPDGVDVREAVAVGVSEGVLDAVAVWVSLMEGLCVIELEGE